MTWRALSFILLEWQIPPMQSISKAQMLEIVAATACLLLPQVSQAERLKKETEQAFAAYVRSSEFGMNSLADLKAGGSNRFLSIDNLAPPARKNAYTELKAAGMIVQPSESGSSSTPMSIPGGLVHDWTGIVFVSGVSLAQVMTVFQDYDHAASYYAPRVTSSRLLQHSGDDFEVFLRLKESRIVTVVFDTEYHVHYSFLDPGHATSFSHSTRISEVEHAGSQRERVRPAGDDQGLLWRLNSYWRFYASDGGVYIQCRAISLTREIPAGLGWLVRPFIETVPEDSLRFTLNAARKAVLSRFANHTGGQFDAAGTGTN
jgi:hypothetical protein